MIASRRIVGAGAVLLALGQMPALADGSSNSTSPRRFADACATCHENNGFGVQVLTARLGAERASLRRDSPLPPAYVRLVVRNGLGAMPAMSRIEITDAELDAIIAELAQGGAR